MTAAAAAPARVDVLAVMDRLTGHARTLAMTGDPAIRESIRMAAEARDAVRELIRLHERTLYVHTLTGNAKAQAWDKLDADIRALLAQVSP